MAKLTERQKKFCDYYVQSGNATDSAKRAGYSKKYANTNASKLLQNTVVREYIDYRNKQLEGERVADMKEVKEMWTSILRDEEVETKDRLKASEYIAKTNGAFLDKVEHSGSTSNEVNIKIDGEEYGN